MRTDRFKGLLSVLLLALLVSGCVESRYRPLDAQVSAMGHEEARAKFLPVLMRHLADQRGYSFARGFFDGSYTFTGARQTEDGRTTIFLFENNQPLAYPWAYVYLSLGEKPRMYAQLNSSAQARAFGTTDDGDGVFRGLYKLTVADAIYCSGETKEMPEIVGNEVRLNTYERALRRSMLKDMQDRYTPTYCQGMDPAQDGTALEGVRFYFDTKEDLEAFASVLMGAFPEVKYSAGPAQTKQ